MEALLLRMYGKPRKSPEDEEDPLERNLLVWFGYLSDEKQQDARTSFVNSLKQDDNEIEGTELPRRGHGSMAQCGQRWMYQTVQMRQCLADLHLDV